MIRDGMCTCRLNKKAFNFKGWIVVISSDRDVCIISDVSTFGRDYLQYNKYLLTIVFRHKFIQRIFTLTVKFNSPSNNFYDTGMSLISCYEYVHIYRFPNKICSSFDRNIQRLMRKEKTKLNPL